jgi:hypothetical protein
MRKFSVVSGTLSKESLPSDPPVPGNNVGNAKGSPVMREKSIITHIPAARSRGAKKLDPKHHHPFLSPIVPSGEGPSRSKGKGAHPGNWGAADFSEQFAEADFEAQRAAFANYEEINRVIKSEELTPVIPLAELSDEPSGIEFITSEYNLHQLLMFRGLDREAARSLARQIPKGLRI